MQEFLKDIVKLTREDLSNSEKLKGTKKLVAQLISGIKNRTIELISA